MAGGAKTRVELDAVPETTLWTLYHRAVEARRPDAVIHDPLAVDLVEAIDHPFAERFGAGRLGQWQALRARCFDREVERFAAAHPGGTVVALGEGLETQFWRVDDGRLRWVTVDLPEIVAVRERLLPGSVRLTAVAGSALDLAWLEAVDPARGALVTAQGLLMYFEPDEVHGLLATVLDRLPHAALVFDAVPGWLRERSERGKLRTGTGYEAPPWRWSLDRAEEGRLRALGLGLRRLPLPRGRGAVHGALLPLATRTPRLRDLLLSVRRATVRR